MVITAKEQQDIDKKFDKQKHALRRFVNINISHVEKSQDQQFSITNAQIKSISEKQDKMFDLMLKAYQQSVDIAVENEKTKGVIKTIEKSIDSLNSSESNNSEKIDTHIKKMAFYVWLIDNKIKVLISLPIITGFIIKLKEPLKEYGIELLKLWK